MSWLALFFALEVGILPDVSMLAYTEPIRADYVTWGVIFTELDVEAELWGHLFAGGTVRTYMLPKHGKLNFSPRYNSYDFRAGVRWQPLELGWRHRCFHPMMPYLPLLSVDLQGIEGAYNEIYFRVEIAR